MFIIKPHAHDWGLSVSYSFMKSFLFTKPDIFNSSWSNSSISGLAAVVLVAPASRKSLNLEPKLVLLFSQYELLSTNWPGTPASHPLPRRRRLRSSLLRCWTRWWWTRPGPWWCWPRWRGSSRGSADKITIAAVRLYYGRDVPLSAWRSLPGSRRSSRRWSGWWRIRWSSPRPWVRSQSDCRQWT